MHQTGISPVQLLDKPMIFKSILKLWIISPCAEESSFKCLPKQLLMVVWKNSMVTENWGSFLETSGANSRLDRYVRQVYVEIP
jgi:hypothetical protein